MIARGPNCFRGEVLRVFLFVTLTLMTDNCLIPVEGQSQNIERGIIFYEWCRWSLVECVLPWWSLVLELSLTSASQQFINQTRGSSPDVTKRKKTMRKMGLKNGGDLMQLGNNKKYLNHLRLRLGLVLNWCQTKNAWEEIICWRIVNQVKRYMRWVFHTESSPNMIILKKISCFTHQYQDFKRILTQINMWYS